MTGRSTVGGNRPEISAGRRTSSSSRPRLPGGLVSSSRARWARRPGAGSGMPMRLRRFGRSGIGGSPWRAVFDEEGKAGNHEGDAIGGGREALVNAAEGVLEAYAYLRRGVDAGADLIGHDDERGAPLAHQSRQRVSGREDLFRGIAPEQEIRHPEREAVEDDEVDAIGQAPAGLGDLIGLFDGAPALGPVRLMTRDAPSHVPIGGSRRGEITRARLRGGPRGELDGLAALAAADAAEDQVRLLGLAPGGPPGRQ